MQTIYSIAILWNETKIGVLICEKVFTMSFDTYNGVLFTADGFGSFKALDGKLFNDEVDWDRDWLDEGRRYLTNIVGKYGPFIQDVLNTSKYYKF